MSIQATCLSFSFSLSLLLWSLYFPKVLLGGGCVAQVSLAGCTRKLLAFCLTKSRLLHVSVCALLLLTLTGQDRWLPTQSLFLLEVSSIKGSCPSAMTPSACSREIVGFLSVLYYDKCLEIIPLWFCTIKINRIELEKGDPEVLTIILFCMALCFF